MFLLLVSIMTWGQVNPFSSHEPIPENHITDKNIQIGALQFIDIKSNGTCHRSILSSNDFNNNSRYIACIINDSEAMDFVLELDNYLIDSIKIYKKDRDAEIELSTFSENSKDSKPLVHFPLAKDSSINIIYFIFSI